MKERGKRGFASGAGLPGVFAVLTLLVRRADVQPLGVNGTDIGFAALNTAFHSLTGVHWALYTVADWLSTVLSAGLFLLYRGAARYCAKDESAA